ncbi:MAG TPA: LLM class flavin-dependent oxidoreductase [Candidatus Binataceae bacterium]|nr:LLM class flavin-dependent oxidoreductase [Candidatus Binataceae bacterium]
MNQRDEKQEPLQLGLFMPNCSNLYSFSSYKPVPDDWTYASNKAIAIAAEDAGFDFLFPLGKWRGFGGKTNLGGLSLETTTWASSLLAVTNRIKIFSTVHVPMFHPLAVAKMGATMDHIGDGRWGLNVVSGFSSEMTQMGTDLLPHDERYRRTEDYITILKGLWTFEPGSFNHESPWYKIVSGYVNPPPVQKPHPPIANAGVSEAAREMSARLCDWSFISAQSVDNCAAIAGDIKQRADRYSRHVRCACYPFVLWRETEREAQHERRRILEHMDRAGVENFARDLGIGSGSYDNFTLEMLTFGAGAMPIIGTAEQAAEELARLYRSGVDGVLMCFLSYLADTIRFRREIMPLLEQLGIPMTSAPTPR